MTTTTTIPTIMTIPTTTTCGRGNVGRAPKGRGQFGRGRGVQLLDVFSGRRRGNRTHRGGVRLRPNVEWGSQTKIGRRAGAHCVETPSRSKSVRRSQSESVHDGAAVEVLEKWGGGEVVCTRAGVQPQVCFLSSRKVLQLHECTEQRFTFTHLRFYILLKKK